ncbi:primosomal protein DnaI [Paenibacillus ginsengarvi]|uniref:Primosomal protein DnaI n=1 Tax=Paenibacillus ginsengarvi TaxID=400777 RepID=A0A3B0CT33_9BACL|nr:primosomal protein DnaI [Paenibacillus ginsengarvi]RKN86778.1 primosomal protein DnaI [Paenibacillus ginsengarvi]
MKSAADEFAKWVKPDLYRKLQEQRERLEQHPAVKQLRTDFPDSEADHNSLYQLTRSYDECNRCTGLDGCKNALKGHFLVPVKNGETISLTNKACGHQLAFEKQEAIKRNISSHYIPDNILNTRFEDLEQDAQRAEGIKAVLKFCLSFKPGQHKGIYLYGPFGVGKSAIMAAAARELASRNTDVLMIYVPDFLGEIKSAIKTGDVESKLNALREVSVLILDDIGAEPLTAWTRDEVLGPVLQRRMQRLPTLYTSNLMLDELRKHLSQAKDEREPNLVKGARLMERIEPFVTTVRVGGKNRRRA